MRAVIQRVSSARVVIEGKEHSRIGKGILVLLGVEKEDTVEDAQMLAQRIVELRIFEDEADKMNRSIRDSGGEILVVSQFTLLGDCRRGRRPSFDPAAPPDVAGRRQLTSRCSKLAGGRCLSTWPKRIQGRHTWALHT